MKSQESQVNKNLARKKYYVGGVKRQVELLGKKVVLTLEPKGSNIETLEERFAKLTEISPELLKEIIGQIVSKFDDDERYEPDEDELEEFATELQLIKIDVSAATIKLTFIIECSWCEGEVLVELDADYQVACICRLIHNDVVRQKNKILGKYVIFAWNDEGFERPEEEGYAFAEFMDKEEMGKLLKLVAEGLAGDIYPDGTIEDRTADEIAKGLQLTEIAPMEVRDLNLDFSFRLVFTISHPLYEGRAAVVRLSFSGSGAVYNKKYEINDIYIALNAHDVNDYTQRWAEEVTRYFVFTDGSSNKFWNINIYISEDEESYVFTVTYGKVGSNGQTSEKEFDSEEECQKEADKLIAQKLKKGYVEKDSEE